MLPRSRRNWFRFWALAATESSKPGGVLALVLPFYCNQWASWASLERCLLRNVYDVTVVSIAANGHDMSFSSDTGMAECLVIGRKPSDK